MLTKITTKYYLRSALNKILEEHADDEDIGVAEGGQLTEGMERIG